MSVTPSIDALFARWLAGKTQADAELLYASALLVSRLRGDGHGCVPLAAWSGRRAETASSPFPAPMAWRERLLASGLVSDGATVAPLVVDDGRLYLYRYWHAERRLAEALGHRVAAQADDISAAVSARFCELFPDADAPDWQAVAAATALRHRLTVVVGGPGTGKTSTVARMLALLTADGRDAHIALAAPTGKAAQRLRSALAEQLPRCGTVSPALQRAAGTAGTVHRLLGLGHDGRCRFGPDRHLPVDILVVDEASMLDLLLMDALLAALPPQARLILLGDAGQLASVEAGSVLADLTRLAPPRTGLDAGRSAALAAAQGRTIQGGMASTWSDHIIRLQINHRSRAHPALAALAVALREGDAAAVGRVLDDAAQHDAKRVEPAHLDTAIDLIWDDCRAAMTAPGPAEALAALGRARILCALNDGPRGVAGLNRAVEARLRQAQVPVDGPWYRGRPVLIGANDPANGLFNGDLGVAWDGAVWFDDGHGGVRSVAPALLPEHRTAWAMTVHKAQGCEFIRVAVVLPDAPHALVTRELIYTAVTRAREQVRLVATPEVLAAACAASAVRESGLAERLRTMAV